MKVLLSAFACAPGEGSEPGVGWEWCLRIGQRHRVWVLLRHTQRHQVERWRAEHPECTVRFVYVPLPLPSAKATGARWRLIYYLWQWQAGKVALDLHSQVRFDVAHHLTYASYRTPSFLPLLPDCPFVWGPLGGGEQAPRAFYRPRDIGWKEALKEHLRLAANAFPLGPLVRWNASRAAAVLVQTPETRARFPERFHPKIAVFLNNRPDLVEVLLADGPRPPGHELRLLTSGRLLAWKGGHLVLRALARAGESLKAGQRITLTFVGSGPFKGRLEALVEVHRLGQVVRFVPQLSRSAYLETLRDYHLFALPSFNDSASLAAVEALAAGLPVLGLPFGGVGQLIDGRVGEKIQGRDPEEAVDGLAEAMLVFLNDPALWQQKSDAARRFATDHCDWERILDFLDGLYEEACRKKFPQPSVNPA